MRKGLYLVLSLLVVFSLGAVFLHCGDDNGGCECEGGAECCEDCPDCAAGTRCDFSNSVCGDCCADAPADELHIFVSGMVMDMTTQTGVAASLAAISPLDALNNENPTHLDEVDSGADGLFKTGCFDVKPVGLGMVMLSDDVGFDGILGTYFPSGTGVKAWTKNSEKYCPEESKVFAVPNTLVAALDGYTSVDSANYGFVMGFVVDSTFSMVPGAVIKKSDGIDLAEVIYPNPTFDDYTGTETSATGIFVLPHTNFTGGLTEITAEKTGMTFGAEQSASKKGFCYFTFIQAE